MNYYIDTEFLEGPQKEKFPISLFRKETKPTIDLISIGIVAEDGREYYSISKDFNLKEAWNRFDLKLHSGDRRNLGDGTYKEYWIRENVLKPIWIDLFLLYEVDFTFLKGKAYDAFEQELKEGKHDKLFTFKSFKALVNRYGKTNEQIAKEIKEFTDFWNDLDSLLINTTKQPIKINFYAYYADYDWVAFCWLFGKMMDLPKGFPMYCRDLKQDYDFFNANFIERKKQNAVGNIHKSVNELKDFKDYPKQENEHSAICDARWNKKLHEFLK